MQEIIPYASSVKLWWLVSAMLVFLMQIGFIWLESGCVRSRHMGGIAIKNFMMFLASTLAYSVVGFQLMYGSDVFGGLFGWELPESIVEKGAEWRFYQTGFAAIAATIVSGAIAERTTLFANVLTAAFVAGLVYPLYGHWVWGDGNLTNVHDFAGAAVVHCVGGGFALAGAWVAGPRIDRFDRSDEPRPTVGSRTLAFAAGGVLFLWVGWIGFNGGSYDFTLDSQWTGSLGYSVGQLVLTTGLGASAGGFGSVSLIWLRRKFRQIRVSSKFDPWSTLSGAMGGMVAVTAACDLISASAYPNMAAVGVGAVGGIVTTMVTRIVLRILRVDDPVDAVAVHFGGGAAGLLIATAFKPSWLTVLIQFQGVIVALTFSLFVGIAWFHLLKKIQVLNISVLEQQIGATFEEVAIPFFEPPYQTRNLHDDLKSDLRAFFFRVVAGPIHRLWGTANYLEKIARDFDTLPVEFKELARQLKRDARYLYRLQEEMPEELDAAQILEDALGSYSEEKGYGDITFVLPTYTADEEPWTIYANKDLVVEALRALISNAVKANREYMIFRAPLLPTGVSGYSSTVRCQLERKDGVIAFVIEDNGIGVPVDIQIAIGYPLRRRWTPAEDHIDLGGLGLFLAKFVAEMYGGYLHLSHTEPDKGSRFDLVFPTEPVEKQRQREEPK